MDVLHDGSIKLTGENEKDSPSSALTIASAYDFKHRRSSSKWNDDISQAGSTITETTQVGELFGGSPYVSKLSIVCSDFSSKAQKMLPKYYLNLVIYHQYKIMLNHLLKHIHFGKRICNSQNGNKHGHSVGYRTFTLRSIYT